MYNIERMNRDEINDVISLVKQVFDAYVGSGYSEEGKRNFNHFVDDMTNRESDVFVAKADKKLLGMIEMNKGHISLFFVDSDYFGKGIGRTLFETASKDLLCDITVNASDYAIKAYEALGFVGVNQMQKKDGIIFLPMVKKSPLVLVEESPDDYKAIDQVLISAFETDEEMKLVNRLRESKEYIHHLSTVAKLDGKVIGHCMMTKIRVAGHEGYLALAPVAVHESYQGKSVGSLLIKDSIKRAGNYKGIVVLGHKDYYPKFGFELASKYGIECPFKVPDENYMYLKITDSDSGVVEYSKAFG